MNICISSGHGLHVAGASALISEVPEARRVTNRVAKILRSAGVGVNVFHDDTSRTQTENLSTIVNHHNRQTRDIDVSIHFNAVPGIRDAGIGVETLYRRDNTLMRMVAQSVSQKIHAVSGLILRRDRGAFAQTTRILTATNIDRAVLVEVCFVNSHTDVRLYQVNFDAICHAIAEGASGRVIPWGNAGGNTNANNANANPNNTNAKEIEEMRFNTVEELPSWARPTIQKLVDMGLLQGTGTGFNLSEDMVRMLVINDRAGLYDK